VRDRENRAKNVTIGPGIWKLPMGEIVKVSWLPTLLEGMPISHAVIWWIGTLFLLTHAPVW
jgi:ethanolaminephosphotransferase